MQSHCLKCQKATLHPLLCLEFYNLEEQGPHLAQGIVLKQAAEDVNHRAELVQHCAYDVMIMGRRRGQGLFRLSLNLQGLGGEICKELIASFARKAEKRA